MIQNFRKRIHDYFLSRPGFEFWFILLLMFLCDRLVAETLRLNSVLAAKADHFISLVETLSDILFGIILICMYTAWTMRRMVLVRWLVVFYTSFAMFHLVSNLMALVFGADAKRGDNKDMQKHPIDYLFLSFNVSSTLGPTMEPVVSRRAKLLMILQTVISLIIIVVLAARAVSQIGSFRF